MIFWITLWKFCLIATLLVFAAMSVLVTIGGALDIRRMFRKLSEPKTPSSNEPQ